MQTYPEIVAVGHLCMDKLHICERMPQENTSAHILSYTQQPGGTASVIPPHGLIADCAEGEAGDQDQNKKGKQ